MRFIEFKQHNSTAEAINYIAVLLSAVYIREWKSKFHLGVSKILFAIKHNWKLKYFHE